MPPNENPEDYMKMYILINRPCLSLVQCGVQAGHSIAHFIDEYGHLDIVQDWVKNHKTMIFLEANLCEIDEMKKIFEKNKKTFKSFYEPDLNDLETACTFEPILSTDGKNLFAHLKLLN